MMITENGFSSPRNDSFPAGLRVLVVDDDPTWLKILEKMLKKCFYEVTTCGLARDALNLLREKKDGYDIVISDVNMPDMDGFKLLEHVGLEMDLPVIMMSVDGETSRVMKGVQHGACDYLLKPIRMKELRNIWQHVFRKRIHEVRDIENFEGIDGLQMMRNGSDTSDDSRFYSGEETFTSSRKRKDENKYDDKDFTEASSSTKKARVVWSVDLHQKFVKAVNQIGYDKVGPKRILDLMNVPWLTRENVASHLQKYRLYLSRLQKENDLKTSFGGMKQSDNVNKEPPGGFSPQKPSMHQSDLANESIRFSGYNQLVHNSKTKVHEIDSKGMASMPAEAKRSLYADAPDRHMAGNSHISFNRSLSPLNSELKYNAFDSATALSTHYSWRETPEIPFRQENNSHLHIEDGLKNLPEPALHKVNKLQKAPSIGRPFSSENKVSESVEYKPPCVEYRSRNACQDSPTIAKTDCLPVIDKCSPLKHQAFEPITDILPVGNPANTCSTTVMNSVPRLLTPGNTPLFAASDDNFHDGWLLGDSSSFGLGLQNIEFAEYADPALIAGIPINIYDALRFDYEQFPDSTELSVIDQGLFIA